MRSICFSLLLVGSLSLVHSGAAPAAGQTPGTGRAAAPAVHWAFRPPVRPPLPPVRNGRWPRNAIDFFILARLEQEGLHPAPEADRATLIRRVSLDLTGLPPTVAEVDAFRNDSSPNAYEKVVGRLLASPRYGERWARPWLDLARYADTNGYEKDRPRTLWPWRDWVIRALNDDMPFDQFTIEQLAGDLLPGATVAQQVATGFHRNTLLNDEDGTNPEEFRVAAVKDRVDTTATVWLGQTLECAQCHNHKYDPFTQREYYQLYAFFNQTADTGVGNGPELALPGAGPDETQPVRTLVMQETATPRATYVMPRGDFKRQGPPVAPGVPAVLHPFPEGAPRNRLGLARWLVARENPLVARVTVNRFWDTFFGRGLVRTPDDFGSQGKAPTHPQLLDWLAVEFMDRGWGMKAMHRLIVTSATYRQSAGVSPALAQRDPYNLLYARGPRLRVEYEMLRDLALAAGGLLSNRIGGPSVMPPQPPGVWENSFGFLNLPDFRWEEAAGDDRYRRGIYIFLRRTALYPTFLMFDAPSREVCSVHRSRTNTPLQALATLNDPAFVEAAGGLARRVLTEAPGGTKEKATFAFRVCLARVPETGEGEALGRLYEKALARFTRDPKAAAALVRHARQETSGRDVRQMAAWMVVANVLLNLDEMLTKG